MTTTYFGGKTLQELKEERETVVRDALERISELKTIVQNAISESNRIAEATGVNGLQQYSDFNWNSTDDDNGYGWQSSSYNC